MDKLLIVGPSWIGDMVMAQSLCISLRERRPGCVIDMLAPAWSIPVVERMPEVRSAVNAPFAHGELRWRQRRGLGKELQRHEYQQAIVLPRSFKAALVPFYARVPRRTGYRGEMRYGLLNDIRRLDPERLPRTVDRYVALGFPQEATDLEVPQPRLRVDNLAQQAALSRLGVNQPARVIGLMPGAEYGPAKQWPVHYFGELARTLTQRDIEVWIFGSDKDRPTGEQITAASAGQARNLCGKTSLSEAIDLIALCSDVVSNDSGLMHVAAACGVRVVALYGSSSPKYTPPLTDNKDIVWLNIECSPCFDRTCRFGHYRCLQEISPQQVFQLVA